MIVKEVLKYSTSFDSVVVFSFPGNDISDVNVYSVSDVENCDVKDYGFLTPSDYEISFLSDVCPIPQLNGIVLFIRIYEPRM